MSESLPAVRPTSSATRPADAVVVLMRRSRRRAAARITLLVVVLAGLGGVATRRLAGRLGKSSRSLPAAEADAPTT